MRRFKPMSETLPVIATPGDINPMTPILIDYRSPDNDPRPEGVILAEGAIKAVIGQLITIVLTSNTP